jgi:hypothetical protein
MRIQSLLIATALWAAPAFAQAPVAPAPIGLGPVLPVAPATDKPSVLTADGTLSVCNGFHQLSAPVHPETKQALLPPDGSGPVVWTIILCFPKQGNQPLVDSETYLYYIPQAVQLVSLPSQNIWRPYNQEVEDIFIGDHKRLWGTGFLDDLKIEVIDFPFANGVIGKVIVYELEERQRIKNTIYNDGTKAIEQAKVEERLRELGITIRLDSFVDQATEKKVANVIRELMVEKGYQEAKVDVTHEPMPGLSPKTVALKFKVTEGPKIKISNVDFIGNTVYSDRKIKGRMKTNKGGGFWIFPGSSVYQEDKFEEDAEMVVAFYRDRGYLQVNVGQPSLKPIRDSKDGKERFMTLEIPITEGQRYRVEKFEFAGNDKVPAEIMRPLFKMKTGDYYNEKRLREGFQKIQEIYGTGGHFEMTPYPEFVPEGDKVNVTIRINEGKQYYINRITFQGNTTTRDSVIRRELRLYENSVYNTEALKYSIKRLNQLGYFKPLEDQKNITTAKTPGVDNKVDLTLKLEEQNRNRRTRQRLSDRVHGAVPLRSAHHRIDRSAPARHRIPVSVHTGVDGRQYHDGSAAEKLLPDVLPVQLRPGVRARSEPGVLRRWSVPVYARRVPDDRLRQAHARTARSYRVQPVPERCAPDRPRRAAHDQQDHADLLAQLDRQPDYADPRQPVYGDARDGGTRGQHALCQSDGRIHEVLPPHGEDLARSARPGGIHPVARQLEPAADLRATGARRRVQRARL